MKKRLIELILNAPRTDVVYGNVKLDKPIQTAQTIADHLLANGVIVPPCKVGDEVYMPWEFDDAAGVAILTITHIIFDTLHAYIKTDLISDCDEYLSAYLYGKFSFEDFGKTVFLDKEQAEKALAERSEGK